jgi:integrase
MTSLLQQILKRAGLWETIGRGFQPLPLPRESPGRCITDEEEKTLLRTAILHSRWEHLYFFILLSLKTTMGPGEAKCLRRLDFDMEKRVVRTNPNDVKNPYRARLLPLYDSAFRVSEELLAAAAKKGSVAPEHYVFPFFTKRHKWVPTKHATTFKTVWHRVLKTANLNFRLYDLRHTAITRLCENPENSEETILSIAGHCSGQMLKKYSYE